MDGIRSLIGFGNQVMTPSPFSALPPSYNYARLYLDIFRGEPAITQFDWPFTPYHRSSKSFATLTCSALHAVLPALQPVHDKITGFRVYPCKLNRPFKTRFRYGYVCYDLTLLAKITR
jgi:hypothetical protein